VDVVPALVWVDFKFRVFTLRKGKQLINARALCHGIYKFVIYQKHAIHFGCYKVVRHGANHTHKITYSWCITNADYRGTYIAPHAPKQLLSFASHHAILNIYALVRPGFSILNYTAEQVNV